MLIGTTTFALLFYGSLVVAGMSALVYLALREGRAHPPSTNVPTATVRGKGARRTGGVPLWLFLLLVVGGCVSAYELHTSATDVWLVTDGEIAPDVDPAMYLGSPRAAYTMAPGVGADRSYDREWVVNRSTRTVRVESVRYGGMPFGGSDPQQVPPDTACPVYHIDDVGPGHPPPREVQVTGFAVKMGMASREWLTWDP